MAIHGSVGAVYVPQDLTGTNSVETFSGDDVTTTFTVANEYIKPGSETITIGGTETKAYTMNYITGDIVFETEPVSGTDNIEVDYDHFDLQADCGFFSWSVDENADAEEATTFCSDGDREYIPGLKDWNGTADKYWLIDEAFHGFVGKKVVIVFYVDEAQQYRYEGWGIVTGVSFDVAVDSLIEQTIDIQGSGELIFRQP